MVEKAVLYLRDTYETMVEKSVYVITRVRCKYKIQLVTRKKCDVTIKN